jgi:hypothetical protein
MRFSPGPFAIAVAAFAAGYLVSHTWRSGETQVLVEGLKPSFLASRIIASASTAVDTPTERLVNLLEQPGTLARDHELFESLQKMSGGDFLMAVADFPALVKRFEKLPPNLRYMMAQAAMERWLEVDPDGAKRWMGGAQSLMKMLPKGHGNELDPGVAMAFFPLLAQNDPAWAHAKLKDIEPGNARRYAIPSLLTETAKTDPRRAREIFAEFTNEDDKGSAVEGLMRGLVESDPQGAIEMIRGLPNDSQLRTRAILSAIFSASNQGTNVEHDLLALIDDPKVRCSMTGTAIFAINYSSTSDPFEFVEQELASSPDLDRDALFGDESIIRGLASRDPNRMAGIVSNLGSRSRDKAVQTLLETWTNKDPATAIHWLAAQPPDIFPMTVDRWDQTMTQLANGAPEEFERLVTSLPAGEMRDRTSVLLATRFAQTGDVTRAVQLFRQSATDLMSAATARTFGRTIATQDPAAAVTCVTQLPPGRAQSNAAEGIATVWSARNPQAAAAWVAQLPAGSMRDSASGGLARTVVDADPRAATEWVEQIRDPAVRTEAASAVYRIWRWDDPALAREWVGGLDHVDADQVNVLLR